MRKEDAAGAPKLPESLRLDMDGPVAILRLERAHKRNALNDPTVLGIGAFFAQIQPGVRAVLLTGSGEHFSAGLDLSELQERDVVDGVMHSRMWHRALDEVQFGSVPVVAVLQGAVVGGGLELAAAAHIRVAEPSAFYALPEGQRGIFVGGGGSARIPRLIGASRMAEMMLTGRAYSGEEGQQIGLSHYLVAPGEGLRKGLELAHKVASNAKMTNFALMHALPRIAESSQDQGLFMEALVAAIAQSAPEAKQRIAQFLSKQAGTRVQRPR